MLRHNVCSLRRIRYDLIKVEISIMSITTQTHFLTLVTLNLFQTFLPTYGKKNQFYQR